MSNKLKRLISAKDRATCAKKVTFMSPEEAQDANVAQKPYRCHVCRQWHLTSDIAGRVTKAAKIGLTSQPLFERKRRFQRKAKKRFQPSERSRE